MLICITCKQEVKEEDCTFGGLHKINDCFGRVFTGDGCEHYGNLEYFKRIKIFMEDLTSESNERCE